MLGFVWRHLRIALVIRTLRGVEGRGVGGLNTYNKDCPPKGPCDFGFWSCGLDLPVQRRGETLKMLDIDDSYYPNKPQK